ncbi:MAG: putative Thioredoxin-disulfide reductase [Verrucomicrobiales bacterium]|nr:putative Thioredoxin-disulfide reductase [Verrucomicrobiales bacterium]
MTPENPVQEVLIVGGGLAGLSAGIYLGRARRATLLIDSKQSLARWEPDVQNYLGFPRGISGEELLTRGRQQAKQYGVTFLPDEIVEATREGEFFLMRGKKREYRARRLLLATGLYHLPPEIPCVNDCLGKSMFFCKDCDGVRVEGKSIAVIGNGNEAVDYALGMLFYSSCVVIATSGKSPAWDEQHESWLHDYEIPVYTERITQVEHELGLLRSLEFEHGQRVAVEALFTTRGDIFHNNLGKMLGAELDDEGQIRVDTYMRTSVPGLYAAGCVTPANCQMIIAAGQGATAAQSINRDLFEESLGTHRLRRFREQQLRHEQTEPVVL